MKPAVRGGALAAVETSAAMSASSTARAARPGAPWAARGSRAWASGEAGSSRWKAASSARNGRGLGGGLAEGGGGQGGGGGVELAGLAALQGLDPPLQGRDPFGSGALHRRRSEHGGGIGCGAVVTAGVGALVSGAAGADPRRAAGGAWRMARRRGPIVTITAPATRHTAARTIMAQKPPLSSGRAR